MAVLNRIRQAAWAMAAAGLVFWLQGYVTNWTPPAHRVLEEFLFAAILRFAKLAPVAGALLLGPSLIALIAIRLFDLDRQGPLSIWARRGARLAAGLLGVLVLIAASLSLFAALRVRLVPTLMFLGIVGGLLFFWRSTRTALIGSGRRVWSRALAWSLFFALPALLGGVNAFAGWYYLQDHPPPNMTKLLPQPDLYYAALSPDGSDLYVSGNANERVWTLDAETGAEKHVLFTEDSRPQKMTVADDGRVFVANYRSHRGEAADQVQILAGSPLTEVARVTHPDCAGGCDVTLAPENRFHVICEAKPVVATFDTNTLALIDKHTFDGQEAGFHSIVETPDAIYLVQGYDGHVLRLDPGTWTETARAYVGVAPGLAKIWPEENALLVSRPLAGQILVLDADDLSVKETLRAGFGVRFFDIDQKNRIVLAGNFFEGTVRWIDYDDGHTAHVTDVGPLVRGVTWDKRRGVVYATSLPGAWRIVPPW